MGILINMKKKTLYYYYNGKYIGIYGSFKSQKGDFFLTVILTTQKNSFSIDFPKNIPKEGHERYD
jgi:hypothetical protein